ncbi:MAG: ABC transporter substrate-binding protein, partial [Planctomycetota bacterium]
RYGFSLGTFRMTDDRQQVLLTLDPNIQSQITAFSLAQQLVQRGDPDSDMYDPSWAAIFDSVTTRTATQLLVNLRRPNVLPHSLMQWALPNVDSEEDSFPGEYAVSTSDDIESSFRLREETAGSQPVEVVEVFYDDPRTAVNDLLRGEIDVLDQLYPTDANRLAADPRLTVGSYALPTSHMLIPISDHAYLSRTKFRRALLYAVDREQMLAGELLGSRGTGSGRLLSGPFPLGNGESDPLAYAYNPEIKPTEYSPELARLLVVMSTKELYQLAEKRREPKPELKPLLVGCPDFEFARVAVQAMIQQWANVGIPAEMKILESIEDAEAEGCDLAYVITTMWEPATDIERLLGGNGIATTDDPFIIQGLERLRNCRNWREIRVAMQDLHQLIDFHLPLLPLWQVTDRFAANNRIEGLEDRPVSLYQNVANWRINLSSLSGSGSR